MSSTRELVSRSTSKALTTKATKVHKVSVSMISLTVFLRGPSCPWWFMLLAAFRTPGGRRHPLHSHTGLLQPPPPCVSFLKQQRLACKRRFLPGWIARKRKFIDSLHPERLPKHIAIIMDGNGRWARRRHLPRMAGHRAGVASVRSTVETAARIGIPWLTLYAFSEENWKKRPRSEVDFLMGLLCRYLKAEVPTLNKNNIRLEYIGRQHELPPVGAGKDGMGAGSNRRQYRHGADPGAQLQRAHRTGGRVPLARGAAARNGGLDHLQIDEDAVVAEPVHAAPA